MAEIVFDINGADKIIRNIRLLAVSLTNNRSFFSEAIGIVEKFSNQAFVQEGKPKKWAPLAPSTSKARSRRWGYYKRSPSNPRILRWTGNLQDNNEKIITNDYGIFRKKAFYAKFHQSGGKRLPQRKVLTLDLRAAADIVNALQKKIDKDIGIFGLQV